MSTGGGTPEQVKSIVSTVLAKTLDVDASEVTAEIAEDGNIAYSIESNDGNEILAVLELAEAMSEDTADFGAQLARTASDQGLTFDTSKMTMTAAAPYMAVSNMIPKVSKPLNSPTASPVIPDSSARDDPHIVNLAHESFSVHQPGKYTFLRVPSDANQPALLEVIGDISPFEGSSCKMYTRFVSVSGEWLGDRAVHVRPLRRSAPGNNNIGHDVYPFSLMVTSAFSRRVSSVSFEPLAAGEEAAWQTFDRLEGAKQEDDESDHGLPDTFRISAIRDERFDGMAEAQTFLFLVGAASDSWEKASILVRQASHQALNVELVRANKLGAKQLGGLLGTEIHDVSIESFTSNCRLELASRNHTGYSAESSLVATKSKGNSNGDEQPSLMAASWWH